MNGYSYKYQMKKIQFDNMLKENKEDIQNKMKIQINEMEEKYKDNKEKIINEILVKIIK